MTDVLLNRGFRRLRVYSVVVFLATVVSGCLSATPETYKFETVRRPGLSNPSSTFIVRLVNVLRSVPPRSRIESGTRQIRKQV